jgi:hypothetical protein
MLGLTVALAVLGWPAAGVARAASATARFDSPGEYSFPVPNGVPSATIIAIGATGGSCGYAGGLGAAVTATVPVSSGELLFVGVGASGGPCRQPDGGSGGIGGGGNGGAGGSQRAGGAGGGGASLVGLASPSAGFSGGPLVVAGGGGGGANSAFTANGGSAGSPGGGGPDGGGGAGTLTTGGIGGVGPSPADRAGSGSFGLGGTGGNCGFDFVSGGGGGGGGYYGGGGGGACGGGGGGGGSSFVIPAATVVIPPTPTTAPAGVSITYPAPIAEPSATELRFGTQAAGTAGAAQTLTVTNKGSASLIVSGVQLGGDDPDDFLVGDRCRQPLPVGSSCQVGVRFGPQASGARSATLTLLTNASHGPKPVALAGTGTGVSGPARPPTGTVAMISCDPVRVGTTRGEPGGRPTVRCARTVVSGRVMFSGAAPTRATIVRGHVVFAVGVSTPAARGGSLLVLKGRRPLKRGTYTLILRHRLDRRSVSQQISIVLG